MESFRTAFRLIVMLAAIGIGYKAWQLYGPPTEQLKAIALRALDVARSALESPGQNGGGATTLSADPRPTTPTFGAPPPSPSTTGQVMQAQALVPTSEMPVPDTITPPALATVPATTGLPEPAPLANTGEDSAPSAASGEDRLKVLYTQLAQLGAHEPQLAPWGSGGQLYRFSCQVQLAGMGNLNRHFDAIAAEPQAAVEAVITKVEAWQSSQNVAVQPGTTLR